MIAHFIASTSHLTEDLPYFHKVVKALFGNGVFLAHDWISIAERRSDKSANQLQPTNWEAVLEENMAAIDRADIVLIDISRYTFAQGFLAALALQDKKSVLLMSRNNTQNSLAAGIHDKNLQIKTYTTLDDIKLLVDEFIQENSITTNDLRFNFFINRQIHNYLRDVAHKTGKNKSEIIRELIEKEIQSKK